MLGIEYLHKKDILYRDLKPENVLFDDSGHVKLADFSLAKENVTDSKSSDSFCGSPAYLPPEMLLQKKSSKASDIYQIGAVLYEMLVGFPPYFTDNQ